MLTERTKTTDLGLVVTEVETPLPYEIEIHPIDKQKAQKEGYR